MMHLCMEKSVERCKIAKQNSHQMFRWEVVMEKGVNSWKDKVFVFWSTRSES